SQRHSAARNPIFRAGRGPSASAYDAARRRFARLHGSPEVLRQNPTAPLQSTDADARHRPVDFRMSRQPDQRGRRPQRVVHSNAACCLEKRKVQGRLPRLSQIDCETDAADANPKLFHHGTGQLLVRRTETVHGLIGGDFSGFRESATRSVLKISQGNTNGKRRLPPVSNISILRLQRPTSASTTTVYFRER